MVPSEPGRAPTAFSAEDVPLQGTFLKLDEIPLHLVSDVVRSLADLGMSTVIVQHTRTFAAGCETEECCMQSGFSWGEGIPGKLAVLLEAAEKERMEVYAGLVMTSTGACGKNFFLSPQSDAANADTVATVLQLESEYGAYSSLRGWYLPDEPGLCELIRVEEIFPYYAQLVGSIHSISARPVLISPHLCGCDLIGMEAFLQRAQDFLAASGADILLWQDSVGAAGISPSGVQGFTAAEAYDRLAAALGTERTWAVLELFNCCVNEFPLPSGGVYRPAAISRLQQQIAASASTDRRVAWLYQHHLSTAVPVHHPEAERLAAFYEGVISGEAGLLRPIAYSWLVQPDEFYSDPGSALFDGVAGSVSGGIDAAWIGLQSQGRSTPVLLLDFGEQVDVDWIALHLLQREEMGIWFPQRITAECGQALGDWQHRASWELPGWISSGGGEYVFANPAPLDLPCRCMQISLENSGWTFLSEMEILGKVQGE